MQQNSFIQKEEILSYLTHSHTCEQLTTPPTTTITTLSFLFHHSHHLLTSSCSEKKKNSPQRWIFQETQKVTGFGFFLKKETEKTEMAQGKLKVRKSKKKNTLAKRKKEAKRTRIAGMSPSS